MTGDSAITHEFSDRLQESLASDKLEELRIKAGVSEAHLSSEWTSALFRLRELESANGKTYLNADTFIHAAMESNRMKSLDWLDLDDIALVGDGTILELQPLAKIMYSSHPGLYTMFNRRERLELASAIHLRAIEAEDRDHMYFYRLAANMNEELAWYDMYEGNTSLHLDLAKELNSEVINVDDNWYISYKVHALFSLSDIAATELLAQAKAEPDTKRRSFLYTGLRSANKALNGQIAFAVDKLDEFLRAGREVVDSIDDSGEAEQQERHYEGRASAVAGTISEGIALSVVQRELLRQNLFEKYWALQAYMRQDVMGRRRLVKDSKKKKDKLQALNVTFDTQIVDHTDHEGRSLAIEVKKHKVAERSKLHPDIEVASLGVKGSVADLLEAAKGYLAVAHDGNLAYRPTFDELDHFEAIVSSINPDRLINRLLD